MSLLKILLSTYYMRDIVTAMNAELGKNPATLTPVSLEFFLDGSILNLCCPFCAGSGIFIIMHFYHQSQTFTWLAFSLPLFGYSK